jgi:hypothetical protein
MAFYSSDFFKNPIRLNRPLSEIERQTQFKQHQRLNEFDETQAHYNLSVIQLNSTFVEIVDRNYPVRGIGTFLSVGGVMLAGFILSFTLFGVNVDSRDAILSFLLPTPLLLGCLYLFFKEHFQYTHYPLRLNRKNGKVYLWRKSGVVVANWARIHFFPREYQDMGKAWDVRGNILAEDGSTVMDSFPLSSFWSDEFNKIQCHFEYFRRYMEEGVQQPYRMLKVCLPLANRRETWWEGCMRIHLLFYGGGIVAWLMFPIFTLPMSVMRYFYMRTSKIPQWPEWVEQECAIEPNDPYVRESGYVAPDEVDANSQHQAKRQPPPRY